jgi:hypothetical protein
MSYTATVCKIKSLRKHPTADRLQLATACGFQVIVGLDTVEGTLGLFLPSDGQLSEKFALANNLVRGVDAEGNKTGGLFDANRRVRAQKLRGQISEGFWCELSYLKNVVPLTAILKLKDGDEFTELDGIPICNKYVTRATRYNTNQKPSGTAKPKNPRFKEHLDTAQFRKCVDMIPPGSLLYLTEKLHGTSARYGRVLCEQSLTRWEKFKKRLGFNVKRRFEYEFLSATRRVVLNPASKSDGYYKTNNFRLDFMKDVWHLLNKGEVIYGEIVGYVEGETSIMPRVYTKTLKDKAFTKQYGDSYIYKYGCMEGACKFFVYRITMVNEDGVVTELSWPQVKYRAASLGLQCVPDLWTVLTILDSGTGNFKGEVYSDGVEFQLQELMNRLIEGPSTLDHSHIREGVVVRVENGGPVQMMKEKSFTFRALEDHSKEDDSAVDIEESS